MQTAAIDHEAAFEAAVQALRRDPGNPAAWDACWAGAERVDSGAATRVAFLSQGVVPPKTTPARVVGPDDLPQHLKHKQGEVRATTTTYYGAALNAPFQYTRLTVLSGSTTGIPMFVGAYVDFGDGRPRMHLSDNWLPRDLTAACASVAEATQVLPMVCFNHGFPHAVDVLTGVPAFDALQRLFDLLSDDTCMPRVFWDNVKAAVCCGLCNVNDPCPRTYVTLAAAPWVYNSSATSKRKGLLLALLGAQPEAYLPRLRCVGDFAMAWALLSGLDVRRCLRQCYLMYRPWRHSVARAWPVAGVETTSKLGCDGPARTAWACAAVGV
jgi:hypothetical protein